MSLNKAAAIGGGVIGAGWVARLLLNGIDVAIFDPGSGGGAQGWRSAEGCAPRL